MSRIDTPMEREPVAATKRRAVGRKLRLEMFVDQRGRCAVCDLKRVLGDLEADHRTPIELGGEHSRANLWLICSATCHKAKTRGDVKAIAKVHRLIAGPKAPKRPIKSQGFRGWKNFKGEAVRCR